MDYGVYSACQLPEYSFHAFTVFGTSVVECRTFLGNGLGLNMAEQIDLVGLSTCFSDAP